MISSQPDPNLMKFIKIEIIPHYFSQDDRYPNYELLVSVTTIKQKYSNRKIMPINDFISNFDVIFDFAKMELKNLDTGKIICPYPETDKGCEDPGLYYNKELFDKWLIFSFDKNKFFKMDKQIYVPLWQNDKWQRGKLLVEMVTPVG